MFDSETHQKGDDLEVMVKASQIAEFLKLKLFGPDIDVMRPQSIDRPLSNSVVFVKEWRDYRRKNLEFIGNVLALIPDVVAWTDGKPQFSHILCPNPRYAFARVVHRFFVTQPQNGIAETAIVAASTDIADTASVGHYSIIGENVIIGENTVIRNHVVIADDVVIGNNCLIKSHAIIGEDGFGFEFDERSRHPERIPHTGSVVISDFVEVGAGSVVCQGTLDNTIIGPHTKLDDQVFIAHNCQIGMNSLIIAKAELSGGVHVGNGVWIGPGSTVKEHVKIGDGAMIGIGANVLDDVDPGVVVVGNPAKFLRMRG